MPWPAVRRQTSAEPSQFPPRGNGVLSGDYASGTINPGSTVTLTLSKPGIYLIGCAFHYVQFHMRDVVQVIAGATPGPTASPGPGGYDSVATRSTAVKHIPAVPQPRLVDQQRRAFTLLSLRGRPLAVTFIAAHCTDACPLINAQFSGASKEIAREHLRARLLTITLDPEHDSPATMREVARRFDADPRYWLLTGGSMPDVHRIMRTFGVISVEGQRGYHDRHTTFVYLFNSDGKLVQTMLASTALVDTLVDAFGTAMWSRSDDPMLHHDHAGNRSRRARVEVCPRPPAAAPRNGRHQFDDERPGKHAVR